MKCTATITRNKKRLGEVCGRNAGLTASGEVRCGCHDGKPRKKRGTKASRAADRIAALELEVQGLLEALRAHTASAQRLEQTQSHQDA